jgi:putative membrane protein
MMGGTTGWMWIWPLLVLAGLLVIANVVVRLTLDERFARGEIDEDEYRRRRGLVP